MKISVIIPTCNRADLVVRALESVRAQTLPADEIIVVDDGSTDDTRARLASCMHEIRYHYQPNQGVSAARNLGISKARGEWIAFLDSDDVWDVQKLEKQWQFHQNNPALRWSHTEEIWIREGRVIHQKAHHAKPQGDCFDENLPFCKIAPSSVLIHQSLFEEAGCFDESLPVCEDYDLWLRFLRIAPVGLIKEALVTKYAGHAQLSRSGYLLDRYHVEALLKHLPDANVIRTIQQKAAILKKGAIRHRNTQMLDFCAYVEAHLRQFEAL